MSRLSLLLLKSGLVIVTIPVVLLMVVFACWTLIPDEAPDSDVLRLLAPRQAVPDADNLYFPIMGFGASADLDPHQAGMNMVAGFNDWLAKAEPGKADRPNFDDSALLGAAPFKHPGNYKSPCMVETASCLAEYEKHAAEFDAAFVQQRAWLDRYRALRTYRAFAEPIPASALTPIPRWSYILHVSDLVDAEIVRDMATPAKRKQALTELASDIAFFQRLGLDSDLLISRMIAAAAMQRKLLLAGEILTQYPAIVKDHPEVVAAIARPLPPEWVQLGKVAEGEFRFMAAAQKDISRDISREFTFGMDEPAAGLRLLESMHGLNAYREQATLNMLARNMRRVGEFYSRSGRDVLQGKDAFQREQDDFKVWSPRVLLFNPIGKILINVGNASWEGYSLRLHDVAGQSRLITLQRRAIENGVAAADMPRLLSSDPALADPYTDQPMQWDAERREIQFSGKSDRAIKAGPFKAKVPG